jgi:hypothetical protein
MSLIYLIFISFVVKSSRSITETAFNMPSIVIWIVSFIAIIFPLVFAYFSLLGGMSKEYGRMVGKYDAPYANSSLYTLRIGIICTNCICIIGFIVFALFPNIMNILYSWVPYLS